MNSNLLPSLLSYTVHKTAYESEFFVTKGSSDLYGDFILSYKSGLIIIDEVVFTHYFEYLGKILNNFPVLKLKARETLKSWSVLHKLIKTFLQKNLEKNSLLVVIGGGVIGDLAGLAANLYKRGISWVYVPTTLLSLSDSCIGGKTALNIGFNKNIVGSFYPPRVVFVDSFFLKTLPYKQLLSGLAEIIKIALIKDKSLFEELEKVPVCYLENQKWLEEKSIQCMSLKLKVIDNDWEDRHNKRVLLNLGHTFGHAFENVSRYRITHGQGVAFGLEMAAHLAYLKEGSLLLDRIKSLLYRFNFSKKIKTYFKTLPDLEKFYSALLKDKKITDGKITILLPYELENVRHGAFFPQEIFGFLKDYAEL